MSLKFVLSLFCLLMCSLEYTEARFYSTAIAVDRLVRDLFVNYDPGSRPAPKGKRIDVNVSIELKYFDFRESDGAFKLNGVLHANWHDPKLGWNPKDYNNVTKIPINSPARVWTPDLEFYNNAPKKFINMQEGSLRVALEHSGQVQWSNNVEITIYCTTFMRNWPLDKHSCKISLGSWTYDGLELDITNAEPNASMSFDHLEGENMEYRITAFYVEHLKNIYDCCDEPYVTLNYHILFERRSAYVIMFRVPALCVIALTLLALSMEPWRGEKLWLNGVGIFIVVFNLIYFAQNVGRFARSTPLIVVFHSCSLVLITFAQLIAVLSLFATRSHSKSKLPWRIRRFLQSPWLKFISPPLKSQKQNQHEPEPADLNSQFEDVRLQEYCNLICATSGPHEIEWIQLAIAVERVGLVAFSFIYLILGTICFV